MQSSHIRRLFLDFFVAKGHREVPSSSLVPADDPTLLFTNAGMVQFKRTFLGQEHRDYARATTCQKCVRAGGKHNDLEQVGHTKRHHTFFEMLGNFSFGDYFKRDAIAYAWEFVTSPQYLGIARRAAPGDRPPHRRRGAAATGGTSPGSPTTASTVWATRTTSGRWATRARAGRATEIYVDLESAERRSGGQPDGVMPQAEFERLAEEGRFLEIWNLVFMQFDRSADGTLTPLPKPSVDTGAGLERIAAVMQGEDDNFHTDLFLPLHRAGRRAGGASVRPGSAESRGVLSRAGRPRPRGELPAGGRRATRATRGGATCCAASCAARCATPGCWAGASPRWRRSPTWSSVQMGEVYPELTAKARLHPRGHRDGGAPLPRDHRGRAGAAGGDLRLRSRPRFRAKTRSSSTTPSASRIDLTQIIAAERGVGGGPRRGSTRALDEQRDALARRAAPARSRSGPRRSVPQARASGAIAQARQAEVRRLRDDRGGHRRPRLPPGQGLGSSCCSRRIRSTPSRAARSATSAACGARAGRSPWTRCARTRRAPWSAGSSARRSSRPALHAAGGRAAPPGHRAQPQRDAPGAPRASQATRHARAAAGLAGRSPTGCASTSRITVPSSRPLLARSRARSTSWSWQNDVVDDPRDAATPTRSRWARWRSSPRSTATWCAWCRWARRSSSAAAPTCAPPDRSGLFRFTGAERRGRGGAPDRGGHRAAARSARSGSWSGGSRRWRRR